MGSLKNFATTEIHHTISFTELTKKRMRLRNGKRSLTEAKNLFERHLQQTQLEQSLDSNSNSEPDSENTSIQVRKTVQPPKRKFSTGDLMLWGQELSAKSKLLEDRAHLKLARSDRQTSELYKLNRRLDKAFCKLMIEKTKKGVNGQNGKQTRQGEKVVAQLEQELKVLREKHAKLTKMSKKSLLQAKRLFTASTRVAEGYALSEMEESVVKCRKGSKVNVGRECLICLDEITLSHQSVKVHKCGHVLHGDCFSAWIEFHSTCPVCRTHLEPKVEQLELPQQIINTLSWADITTTNVSAV